MIGLILIFNVQYNFEVIFLFFNHLMNKKVPSAICEGIVNPHDKFVKVENIPGPDFFIILFSNTRKKNT